MRPFTANGLSLAVLFLLASCSGQVNGVPESRQASSRSISSGRALIASYGCGSCHTIQGIPGADGKAAPPLEHFYERSYIAGRLPNTEENLVHWIQNPQEIDPGTAMPNLGVKEEEARDMAAYLYHEPGWMDLMRR